MPTFCIAFYESYLSTTLDIPPCIISRCLEHMINFERYGSEVISVSSGMFYTQYQECICVGDA